MRFLFRKKGDETDKDTLGNNEPNYSGLGLFSPVIDTTESIQDNGWRRLSELEQIFVRSKKLISLEDVTSIVSDVRDGHIVLLDITSLNNGKEQCRLELKRIIERIRGETRGFRAELALVNDDCVIVTPPFVRMGS